MSFFASFVLLSKKIVSLQRQYLYINMNKKQLLVLLAAIALVCAAFVLSKKYSSDNQVAFSPTEDASQFVTLTDVVPDAILEIRYFGTYNFVGTRIDGYLEPTALLTRQAADSLRASVGRSP